MATLTVATWNIGDKGTWDNLREIMAVAPVICLQEMGDRSGIYDNLRGKGWEVYNAGGDNGRKATPITWNPKAMGTVKNRYCRQLSPKTYAPGTGPDDVKPKYLIGIGWDYPGFNKQVRVGGLHLVSDSGKDNPKRRALATDQIKAASTMWQNNDGTWPQGFCCIAGDFNTSWDNALLDPLRKKGWKPAQGCPDGYVCKTHGNWTPDQQWFRNGKVLDAWGISNKSDHDAYCVTYKLGS